MVLSGSGNKAAEEGSHNPHMRFINALAVDLVVPLKSDFFIESRRSRGGVCGPSPIWLKLGVVTRDTLKNH